MEFTRTEKFAVFNIGPGRGGAAGNFGVIYEELNSAK